MIVFTFNFREAQGCLERRKEGLWKKGKMPKKALFQKGCCWLWGGRERVGIAVGRG